MKYGIVLGLAAMFAASIAMAEGVPSKGKLNKLGLGSMEVVSDQVGEQVRGKAFFKIIASWEAAAGEKAIVDFTAPTDVVVNIDPDNFEIHDSNAGAIIVESGIPLTTGSLNTLFTSPLNIQNTATADHEQTVVVAPGQFAFSEVSASINTFSFTIFSPIVAVP